MVEHLHKDVGPGNNSGDNSFHEIRWWQPNLASKAKAGAPFPGSDFLMPGSVLLMPESIILQPLVSGMDGGGISVCGGTRNQEGCHNEHGRPLRAYG